MTANFLDIQNVTFAASKKNKAPAPRSTARPASRSRNIRARHTNVSPCLASEAENLLNAERDDLVDDQEEDRRQSHHHENHDRGNTGLLASRPGNLADLLADLSHEHCGIRLRHFTYVRVPDCCKASS